MNENHNFIVPVAVFGKDQRKNLPRTYNKLDRSIGLLHNPRTNVLCTAFCVGPDIIATASHCLFGRRKRSKLYISSFLFKLKTKGRKRQLYSRMAGYRSSLSRQYIIAGTTRLNRKPPIGAARDWAIIRLAQPACRNSWLKTLPLSLVKLEAAARNKKVFQVAYHMDYRNWQIAYSRSCSIHRNFGGLSWKSIKKHFSSPRSLILHQCDTGEASSGSPLLMDTPRGPVVVGINVGTYQQREIIVKNGRILRRTRFKTIANTGVSAGAFSRKIAFLQQAKIITNRFELKRLQIALKERGLYLGTIDGIYGARTSAAIKAFEKRLNRASTGLATRQTLLALEKRKEAPLSSIKTSAGYEKNRLPPLAKQP
ncbi:MAG: peptidoglycan-binding protein [Hyphomicrobiaceae bacterium]|nr:peptidoglycan-binding protein [Hyphomicrobiaceae bacterium]